VTKVLYIEHDDDNLYMLKMRLERVGDFEVLAAEDSEKGCKLALTEHPDVILMDLEMPVVDRWEPVQRLKEDPHRHVRVCAGQRARDRHCRGLRRFDVKPIEFESLVATIRRVVANPK
jgi:CheY-like chemotaxis protein